MLRVELTSDWTRQHMAKAVTGSFWDGDAKSWIVENPDARSAAIVLRLFPELEREYPELLPLRDALNSDARPFDNATAYGKRISRFEPDPMPVLAAEGHSYYDFQDLDLGYLHGITTHHGAAYMGWERGLGKTLGAATLIDTLAAQRTLVCCPNTAKESVWGAELARFLPDHEVVVLPNPKAKREAALAALQDRRTEDHTNFPPPPLVLVIHYEALGVIATTESYETAGGKKKKRVGDGWKQYGEWDLFITDEAHRLSTTTTIMFRAACKVPSTARCALSGSILQNHPEEMFGVLHWLFPETYKRKWKDWCDRYVDYVNDGYRDVAIGFKADRIEGLRQELGVFMTYRRKVDELDLPERTEHDVLLDLAPKQRRAYDDMLTQFYTVLDNDEVLKADNALAQLNHLRRIATGLSAEDAGEVTDSSKLDWVEQDIMDNPDSAYVVFSWYKAPLAALEARLDARHVGTFLVDGDVKQQDRAPMIEAFQQGQGRVFLGSIATLGESVTLHRANQAVFLDRSWNPMANAQAADRIYRIGQVNAVTITNLVSRDTVDELRVQPTLASKESLRRSVFGGM